MTNVYPFSHGIKVQPKLPRVDVVDNSWAWLIREGMLTRIQAMPAFANFGRFSRTYSLQIQPQDIPYLGLYLRSETMVPDGDANAGEPRFIHSVVLTVSIFVQNNDPDAAENKLDQSYWALMKGLLSDPTFYENQQAEIEGFIRGERSHHFGAIALNNETPLAELRFDLTVNFRTTWPPFIPDVLETVHVHTEPDGMTEAVQDVIADYDLEQ